MLKNPIFHEIHPDRGIKPQSQIVDFEIEEDLTNSSTTEIISIEGEEESTKTRGIKTKIKYSNTKYIYKKKQKKNNDNNIKNVP